MGIWFCAISLGLNASATADASRDFFESKIRPALIKHCYECHSTGAKDIGGKLLLDSRANIVAGGESGPAIVSGDPSNSLLIQALRYDGLEMPPEAPLPEATIGDFAQWVKMGAPFPKIDTQGKNSVPGKSADDESLWSFQPILDPPLPKVRDRHWAFDPLDTFVLERLEKERLTPTRLADPKVLIRRMYFDLIGLPPTLQQVESFAASYHREPRQAVSELADMLLASPQFGVRWGRHWLDVARYGESNGNDGLGRNPTFPHAWRYRDYVIQAINDDVPYDRFLTEQIAGDLLPADSPGQRDRQLVATGFLALASKPAKAMNANFDMDVVDDQINVVSAGVMGLSVACARCHDHKHDPISTREYYALAGIFKSTETLWGLAANEKLTAPATPLHELNTASIPVSIQSPLPESKDDAAGTKKGTQPIKPLAMGVRDRAKPTDCKIHIKGESSKLGTIVRRGFLDAVNPAGVTIAADANASGRLELANWLTSRTHPLTARVMVNRIWLHLFGQAIVSTPDDFGVYGERPTHPNLLDHLATRFVANGWSIKRLIRAIVLSRTYQASSDRDERLRSADPNNLLLARQNRRRLDAESFRDGVMQVSGQLDLQPGEGSAVQSADVLVNKVPSLHRPSRKRSVYLCMLRNSPPPELAAFDLPDGVNVAGMRNVTTLPTHALYLLNSPFVVEQARHFAERAIVAVPNDASSRVLWAYRAALNRDATAAEMSRALKFAKTLDADLAATEPDQRVRCSRVWSSICQALLVANEFRYID